jgi:hypothetical protein
MRILVNILASLSPNWKTTLQFLICIAEQRLPFADPDRVSLFLNKMNESSSRTSISRACESQVLILSEKSTGWDFDIHRQFGKDLISSVNGNTTSNDQALDLIAKATLSNRSSLWINWAVRSSDTAGICCTEIWREDSYKRLFVHEFAFAIDFVESAIEIHVQLQSRACCSCHSQGKIYV